MGIEFPQPRGGNGRRKARGGMLAPLDGSATFRCCEWPDCDLPGIHKAPRDRTLKDYAWYCLSHVREYNSRWDFFKGMSAEQIEAEIRRDTCWQRQTWRPAMRLQGEKAVKDPFELFAGGSEETRERTPPAERRPPAEQRALDTLGLDWPLTRPQLKERYKALVKLHHPDANGGAKEAEEKLKDISEAYRVVMAMLAA